MNDGMRKLTTVAAYFLFVLALLLAAYRASLAPPPLSSRLVLNPTMDVKTAASAVNSGSFLPRTGNASHAASLAELADGTIACTWYSGSREGSRDAVIYISFYRNGNWSNPDPIATMEQTQKDTARFVKKVGNPVLATSAEGYLHLWYVTAFSGWSTAGINHRVSYDNGISWSKATRLVTAPLFNVSTLVRMPPLLLADGQFLLPTYHEMATHHGETTRLAADGTTVLGKDRIPADEPLEQPSIVSLPEKGELLAMLRKASKRPGAIGSASFLDAEGEWKANPPPPIANPNSSIALLRLNDGRLLLACNPCITGRYVLCLWLSTDGGTSWREALSVEKSEKPSMEFSYPALLQDRTGLIHLVYTWERKLIAHRVISPDVLQTAR
jgi:predicted neuraminidase